MAKNHFKKSKKRYFKKFYSKRKRSTTNKLLSVPVKLTSSVRLEQVGANVRDIVYVLTANGH